MSLIDGITMKTIFLTAVNNLSDRIDEYEKKQAECRRRIKEG